MIKYLEKHRGFALIITLLIAIEIFYFSSISSFLGAPVKGIDFSMIYHLIVFFLFTFFLLITIKGKSNFKAKHIFWTIVISLIYAILDEVHQLFIPGRFSSISDIMVDLVGIFLAVLIYPKRETKS